MPLISDSEMEDFEAAIVAAGFEVDDFNAEPLEDDESTVIEQYAMTGTVTVHRISTDDLIPYRAGADSSWTQDFAADLYEGKFGEP